MFAHRSPARPILATNLHMPDRDFISTRAAGVDASGIRKVFDLAAKLKDPINFSIGLPDFDVPDVAKAAAIDAIQKGHNRYTQTQGIAQLRDKLRAELSKEFGRDVGDVLITSGVAGGLMLATLSIINPGEEVVYLDPYFVQYRHMLTMTGGVGVPVDSYPDFRFHADRVAAAITPKTKALILNSPSNPTGVVMTQAEVNEAITIAKKHNLLIISDEIYEPFLYDRHAGLTGLASPLFKYEKTLVLRGFSKSHAMTGWRLGYAFGYEPVVSQMAKLQQYTFVCAPTPMQYAAVAAMDVDMTEHIVAYQKKRDIVHSMLSRKFEVERPGGAFYIFPKAPAGRMATEFCTAAIEKNVLIIPGNVFSGRDTHFRISYATTDTKLAEGCDVLLGMV
jgi:aspartate/methionine/tyrosine aminotransferase